MLNVSQITWAEEVRVTGNIVRLVVKRFGNNIFLHAPLPKNNDLKRSRWKMCTSAFGVGEKSSIPIRHPQALTPKMLHILGTQKTTNGFLLNCVTF